LARGNAPLDCNAYVQIRLDLDRARSADILIGAALRWDSILRPANRERQGQSQERGSGMHFERNSEGFVTWKTSLIAGCEAFKGLWIARWKIG
jgi:hypothetical protein